MIVFQVSLNFDYVEEILENMMSDLCFNEVIILRKIQVTMKTFTPPFFNHFSLNLNRKKRVVMRALRKKLYIFTLQLQIYYILEQDISIDANADISKTKQEKQIAFVVQWWMQCLLLQLKTCTAYMGNYPTLSHTCYSYLPSR